MNYISVVIPAYNEGGFIYNNIKEIEKVFNLFLKNKRKSYELIIVNDGSTDNTYDEALRAAKENKKIKVVDYKNNGGKGFALKYGFKFCKGRYVAFIDADLDLHPKLIPIFLDDIEKTGADIVIGSKLHPESLIKYPIYRKILSTGYHLFTRLLFNLDLGDTQTGLKLFRYEVLEYVLPKILCKKYAFDLELLVNAYHNGFKIIEAPIELNWQRLENRLKIKDIWKLMIDTFGIFYRLKIIKYYTSQNTKLVNRYILKKAADNYMK